MPPNRKGKFAVVDATLSTLDLTVPSAKYPPLTAAASNDDYNNEASSAIKTIEVVVQKSLTSSPSSSITSIQQDNVNYDTGVGNQKDIIENIVHDETIRNLFSIDHIEANIVAEKERIESSLSSKMSGKTKTTTTIKENDDYWNMPSKEEMLSSSSSLPPKTVYAKHVSDDTHPLQSYWDWPAAVENESQQKEQLINRIMLQEKNRLLFSIEHIEKKLFENSNIIKIGERSEESTKSLNDNYWDWNNGHDDTLNTEAKKTIETFYNKEEIISRILLEEKNRQLLSVNHIIENNVLQEEKQRLLRSPKQIMVVAEHQYDDGYWDWDPIQKRIEIASHVNDPSHPMTSYWDWNSTVTTRENKEIIIKSILEEEKIRKQLSITHIQDQLIQNNDKKITWSEQRQQNQSSPCFSSPCSGDSTYFAGESSNYWDM